MTRVGDDPNGAFVLGELAALGVDTSAVERAAGVPGSVSAVAVGEDGERLLLNHQDRRLLLEAPSPPAAAFGRFAATLVDTRWPAAGVEALRLARARGVPGIADIDHALPASWLEPTLALASHVVFSRDGLGRALGVDGLERGLAEALRLSPGRIAVTLGGEGVIWLEGRAPRRLPAFPVAAVDTLGAGDVFHGALTVALAQGDGWPEALRFAAAAAAIKCSRPSGREAFATRAELDRFLEEHG
jgi:sulfofructose kinase